MSFLEVKFASKALQMQTAMNVILPDVGKGPYPVYYLLHGLSDSYTIWARRTSIERYVANLPIIVVMPDSGRGWYTNALEGFAYEFHDKFISGNYGALRSYIPGNRLRFLAPLRNDALRKWG